MKFNKLTMGLAAVGVVSLASAARADEKMSQIQTALSNTTLSGYLDVSAQWNPGNQNAWNAGPGNPVTAPYAYGGPGKADGFNFNSLDLTLDRPMDESPWAAGYHLDLQMGPDAPAFPRQAYLALRTPVGNSGIDWKVGVFDTIIGYESSSSPLNPNYSRSYGYSIEPTTHTGILATYKVNDMLSLTAGVANSSNVGFFTIANHTPIGQSVFSPAGVNGRATLESQKAYMGSIAFTAPDSWGWAKGATMNAGIINADNTGGAKSTGFVGSTSFYAGATIPTPLTALKVGAAFDYLSVHNSAGLANPNDDNDWVIALYSTYQVNDKLSFNARAEYIRDEIGMFAYNFDNGSNAAKVNYAEEVTVDVQYVLWANVLSRVEARWDHVEHGNSFDAGSGNTSGVSFHSQKENAFMLALNLIYQF